MKKYFFALISKHLTRFSRRSRANFPRSPAKSHGIRVRPPPSVAGERKDNMAATQKQIDANRRNAQHSTGPKTEAGKGRASLNAWRHGLTGQVATMPHEDLAVFTRFTADIRQA